MKKDDIAQIVLNLTIDKFRLKTGRVKKVREAREIRREVYNLSIKINALETEIDALIIDLTRK